MTILRGALSKRTSMDRDFLIDLFSDFGPVTIRPMFSGFGISADGINFAMALRAGLYFRADDQTIPQFEAEGSKPFRPGPRPSSSTRIGNRPRGFLTIRRNWPAGPERHWRRLSARP
jgi:hypothetical protein